MNKIYVFSEKIINPEQDNEDLYTIYAMAEDGHILYKQNCTVQKDLINRDPDINTIMLRCVKRDNPTAPIYPRYKKFTVIDIHSVLNRYNHYYPSGYEFVDTSLDNTEIKKLYINNIKE